MLGDTELVASGDAEEVLGVELASEGRHMVAPVADSPEEQDTAESTDGTTHALLHGSMPAAAGRADGEEERNSPFETAGSSRRDLEGRERNALASRHCQRDSLEVSPAVLAGKHWRSFRCHQEQDSTV